MTRKQRLSPGDYYLLVLGLVAAGVGLAVLGSGDPAMGIAIVALGGALVCFWFSMVVAEDAAAPYRVTIDGRPGIVVEVPRRRMRLRQVAIVMVVGALAVSSAEFGAVVLIFALLLAAVSFAFTAGSQRLVIGPDGVDWNSGLVGHHVTWDQLKDGEVKRGYRGMIALVAGGQSLGLERFEIDAERWAHVIIAAGKDPSKRDTLHVKLKVRSRGRARSRQAS